METLVSLLLTAFAVVSLHGTSKAASFGARRLTKRSTSAVSPSAQLPDGTAYGDLDTCALVTCPPVDLSSCELKEVIIWKTGHNRFCRFCEYCLDWPWRAAAAAKARRRRSVVPLLTNENQLLQQEVEMDATEPLHDDSIGNRRKRWTSAVASKSSVDLMSLLQSQLQHSRETRAADKAGRLPADEVFDVLCPYVRCPVAPPNQTCRRTQLVAGWIRGRQCVRCATCADDEALEARHQLLQ